MTTLQPAIGRRAFATPYVPSLAVGAVSKVIEGQIENLQKPSPTFASQGTATLPRTSLDERLFDVLAQFKIRTSQVAMHLNRDWRTRLFGQFDSLLNVEDWEPLDRPPTIESFATFLRLLVFLKPQRRPGLGATATGELIASWTNGNDRLTIECLPQDLVRWTVSVTINEERERAAGITPVSRLPAVLAPYGPDRWFADANHVPA
ncbi:hypothetical protein XH89_20055 [Bradyrhizobium sp. CCBAU 53340]|uniref:hypothetical protein n=1 Tax=Bradyrhizobium sp. CCBAU 53340 TaxID=1325112 RepID=UPI00188CEF44|nr:hypothetical protein [Bradyrhizobium sp. CCBAU 53340]QOZ45521.1 hypothetical protein XH89_20055 [Bradyrhizobium sp. CCBAU 53340]